MLCIDIENLMIPCVNKILLGFECPGCGIQRSLVFLMKGEFILAFKMYPAIFLIIPLFMLIVWNYFLKSKVLVKPINILAIASIITIVINYTLKFIHL